MIKKARLWDLHNEWMPHQISHHLALMIAFWWISSLHVLRCFSCGGPLCPKRAIHTSRRLYLGQPLSSVCHRSLKIVVRLHIPPRAGVNVSLEAAHRVLTRENSLLVAVWMRGSAFEVTHTPCVPLHVNLVLRPWTPSHISFFPRECVKRQLSPIHLCVCACVRVCVCVCVCVCVYV